MDGWNTSFSPVSSGEIVCLTDGIRFDITNEPLTVHEYAMEETGVFEAGQYLVMEYAADGLLRDHALHAPLLLGRTDGVCRTLCEMNDIHTDGKRHRVIVHLEQGTVYTSLKIRFLTKAPKASFRLYSLYSCDYTGLPRRFSEYETAPEEAGFTPVDLTALFNAETPSFPGISDGGRSLPEGESCLLGIPFRFGPDGKNRIAPPPPPTENDEPILNFGVPALRGQCRPVSRDSGITVPIGKSAQEILFAAALSGNVHERWGFCAPDPTVLGTETGEVMMPLAARDVERFQVEIIYADGTADTAFPYNLSLRRHILTGETGLYAVPAGEQVIDRIVFRNRIPDADVSILAVTLNTGHAPLIPALPEKKVHPLTAFGPDGVVREDNQLIVTSGRMQMHINTKDGLIIDRLFNGYAPDSLVQGPLLKLRLQDGSVRDDFDIRLETLTRTEARLLCRREGLICTVTISIAPNDTVRLRLSAQNTGTEELSCGIIFPALDSVTFADWQDGWYLFPKYQNALGNGHISVYEESAPSFPMQFFDLFSPSQDGGLGLMTLEKELTVRKYALTKDERGLSAYVEYPAMYMRLAPGEVFHASPAELFAHAGDWRETFRRYREWLSSWYRPHKSQNKTWYRRCFWLMAEITDFYETESFTRLPSWYNPETKEYYFNSIMEEQKSLYGSYPDILHLWGWTFDKDKWHQMWGHFGDVDYERIGGLENFIGALNDCSEKTGAKVSLYLHPTLLTDAYPEAKEYMPRLWTRCENGQPIVIYDDSYRMCHADETWREHALGMYRRVQRETRVPIMYVDEFSLRTGNRCYSREHTHECPSNLLKTDRNFISALRDAIDEEIVLYGEYAAVDVNARYIDCNITYHILDSIRDMIENAWTADDGDDSEDRIFLDLYRFAFPGIVQLVLPMAMRHLSWQPLKSTFFNGEAIYDSFWDAEESRGREFMGKAFRIKKEYGDCFASDCPETMLSSPLQGVCVNRFPGEGRTLYTLMNRAWETRRGVLLELNDRPGAVYTDVWNNAPCRIERADGRVRILGTIGAQEVGCIAVTFDIP